VVIEGPPDAGIELREAAGAAGMLVCRAPCDTTVDARDHRVFFVGGDGLLPSDRFRLDDRIGTVRMSVAPGRDTVGTASVAARGIGSSAVLGCGIGLPIAARPDAPGVAAPLVGTCFTAGMVTLAIAVPVFVLNKTTYALALSDGARALHF
jgi:hypothetical protein